MTTAMNTMAMMKTHQKNTTRTAKGYPNMTLVHPRLLVGILGKETILVAG